MKSGRLITLVGLLVGIATVSSAQTKLKLAAIKPGTEQVQLIPNGNFQLQGPLIGGNYPNPPGWNRVNDMFANTGTNTVPVNHSVVAEAHVDGGASVSTYSQTVTLEPATAYVFSAYVWNFGDAGNHVNTVIDFNDAPGEPQVVLNNSDSEADKGYFVYNTFNTSTTGKNILVRVFYDGKAGTGAAASYYPRAAQWDNIAITKLADFVAPQASNSTATIRPLVTITNPVHNSTVSLTTPGPVLIVSADATDLDGSVTNVQFFAGTNQIGQASASPWTVVWSGVASSNYVLKALATDDTGATAWSPPVSVTVSITTAPPGLGPLSIGLAGESVVLSWPTNSAPMVVQANSNLPPTTPWQKLTNSIVVANGSNWRSPARRCFSGA